MLTVVKAPGKLMIAGEISVLEGNPCIVMALHKYITVTIQASPIMTLHAPDVGLDHVQVRWQSPHVNTLSRLSEAQCKVFITVQKACEYALRYCKERDVSIKNFLLTVTSEISSITLLDGSIVKPGLGSSAAVTVATVTAILAFHGIDHTNKDLIFKLSYLSHVASQGKIGSGFDIAAATYAQTIVFKRCNKAWLTTMLAQSKTLSALIHQPWSNLNITPITLPQNLKVLVGFVGNSASTAHILTFLEDFKITNQQKYDSIVQAINIIVTNIMGACRTQDTDQIISLIKQHRKLLQQISQACNNAFETVELTKLIEIAERFGAGAKFSGAGGGDCGIAVTTNQDNTQNILRAWQQHNIIHLDV